MKQQMRCQGDEHKDKIPGIPFAIQHNNELVGWAREIEKTGKRGSIDDNLPPILKILGVSEDIRLR